MYHIQRYKIIVLLIFSIIGVSTQDGTSQYIGKDNYNYLDFQKKPYYFGLSMGLHNSGYRINQSNYFINNDSIRIVQPKSQIGLNLQMIANLKIGEYFDFRFLPGFSFSNRSLEYTGVNREDNQTDDRTIESVFVDIPFMVRFKSAPYKDKRGFVVAGIKYSYDVSSNSKSRLANSLVKISPHDFQYEIGLGMQFFFPYFIFSPEIKYSRGLGNILLYNNSLNQSRVLEQVVSEIFTISFHFEG